MGHGEAMTETEPPTATAISTASEVRTAPLRSVPLQLPRQASTAVAHHQTRCVRSPIASVAIGPAG